MSKISKTLRFAVTRVVSVFLLGLEAQAVNFSPGDFIVSEQGLFGGSEDGQIIHIDPLTGAQTVVPTTGTFVRPIGVEIDGSGCIVVADNNENSASGGTIYRVDQGGQQTTIASGTDFNQLTGLTIDGAGNLIVARHGPPAILRVDPFTGNRTVISSGGSLSTPWDIDIDSSGNLIVADILKGIIRIDPASGTQTLISSGSATIFNFRGIAVAASGDLIVAGETINGGGAVGGVAWINPATGVQTLITAGDNLRFPFAIRFEPSGQLVVVEEGSVSTAPAIIRIDPQTGTQSVVSAGGALTAPVGLVVVARISISIDIKPGSTTNTINPKSGGVVLVAVLTGPTFDAATVDPDSVRFGASGTEAAPQHYALEDVNEDGDSDLILHFRTQQTGITCGISEATLTGHTFAGQSVEGSDSVTTVGCT